MKHCSKPFYFNNQILNFFCAWAKKVLKKMSHNGKYLRSGFASRKNKKGKN